MDDNVIEVNFQHNRLMNDIKSANMIVEPENRSEYLTMCKEELIEAEYQMVLCGILDKEIYNRLQSDLRVIIDAYYELDY